MKCALLRALVHATRVRSDFSMTVAASEMGVGRDTLLRYLKGESTPQQPALGAMARWERLHAAPPAQTQAAGLKPSDYSLNLRVPQLVQRSVWPLSVGLPRGSWQPARGSLEAGSRLMARG